MSYLNSYKFVLLLGICCAPVWGATIALEQSEGRIDVTVDDRPFGSYVYHDDAILRPYWTAVHAPDGVQVTRNHPPVSGEDDTDHEHMHPGLWQAFGDVSGSDFWRNKARVQHQGFVVEPKIGDGYLMFTVENAYTDGETAIMRELCRYTLRVEKLGYFLLIESTFFDGRETFSFGDQEEMGLGVRVATPMAVKHGGTLLNSDGGRNEEGVWGKPALWCDYSGTVEGTPAGIAIMPNPANFRPSWFHARDYGFFAANPFGRGAMSGGEKSEVEIGLGEVLELGYAVFIHSGKPATSELLTEAYHRYLALLQPPAE